jgi:hypothetical protein
LPSTGAEREDARVHPAHVHAERLAHLAVSRGGAQDAAEARALEERPDPAAMAIDATITSTL